MINLVTAAALAFVSLASIDAATAAPAETGQSTVVRYADLDLASADGRAALQRRVAHAVNAVCPRGSDNDLRGSMNRAECRSYAQASARRGTEEAMLHRSNGIQVAAISLSGR